MKKAILGRKVGMTQIFDEAGLVIPVTVVEAGPMTVLRKKTVERDGYAAVQFAFEDAAAAKVKEEQDKSKAAKPAGKIAEKKDKSAEHPQLGVYRGVNRPQVGEFKKSNVAPKKVIKEFKLENSDGYEVGTEVFCDIFESGDKVDVSGLTKGRGFTGVIKRWNFHRLKMSHGTGPVHRERGSTGANSTPSKVIKGLRMAGQFGHENVTIQNLTIVKVDRERNVLLIRGAVPGPKGGLVTVKETVKPVKKGAEVK